MNLCSNEGNIYIFENYTSTGMRAPKKKKYRLANIVANEKIRTNGVKYLLNRVLRYNKSQIAHLKSYMALIVWLNIDGRCWLLFMLISCSSYQLIPYYTRRKIERKEENREKYSLWKHNFRRLKKWIKQKREARRFPKSLQSCEKNEIRKER